MEASDAVESDHCRRTTRIWICKIFRDGICDLQRCSETCLVRIRTKSFYLGQGYRRIRVWAQSWVSGGNGYVDEGCGGHPGAAASIGCTHGRQ